MYSVGQKEGCDISKKQLCYQWPVEYSLAITVPVAPVENDSDSRGDLHIGVGKRAE